MVSGLLAARSRSMLSWCPRTATGLLVLLPAALPVLHPLLLPLVGVASHLLWWVHVLPVAVLTYRYGKRIGFPSVLVSGMLLVIGERLWGAGFWIPADWMTVLSLATALTFTHLLVAGFALYARRLNSHYQLLFHNATIGILRVDRHGRVLAANPDLLKTFHLGEETRVVGRQLHEIPGVRDLPSPDEIARIRGWTGRVEWEGDAGLQTLHVVAVALEQGDPGGYQILVVDRTMEFVQEAEIERKVRLATLGEGLAGVAHELNNPLTVILAYAQMAETSCDGEDPDELRDMLASIEDQARRMRGLIQELLGYSRPSNPDEPVALQLLLCRLLRMERVARRNSSVDWIERIDWGVSFTSLRIESNRSSRTSSRMQQMR